MLTGCPTLRDINYAYHNQIKKKHRFGIPYKDKPHYKYELFWDQLTYYGAEVGIHFL